MVLKCGHAFNLLDARGAISVTERAAYIGRIRTLSRAVAQSYYDSRERLGFPMLDHADRPRPACVRPRRCSVEIQTEELPPKALKSARRSVRCEYREGPARARLRVGAQRGYGVRHRRAGWRCT